MKVKCFFKVNYGPFTGKQMIPQVYFMAWQRVAVFWQNFFFFFTFQNGRGFMVEVDYKVFFHRLFHSCVYVSTHFDEALA